MAPIRINTSEQESRTSKSVAQAMPRWLVAVILLLLPVIYFYPAVIGKRLLSPGDGWTANLGLRILLGRVIAQGHLPLWDPYLFGGMPLLAAIYPGALYPPNWIFAILPTQAAMNILVITTFHLAVIGTYLYARAIGCRREAALVAGVAFGFGGYLVAHLGQTSHIAAAVWLPWIVLAVEKVYQQLAWRWVALGAIFIAVQLFAGVPQMNFYTAQVWAASVLFSAFVRAQGKRRWQFLALSGAMAVCGLLLSCVQLLPLRELLPLSQRGGIDYDYFASFSLPPGQVLGLVFPFFFGGSLLSPYSVSYWGIEGGTEMCGYVGLLTLLLGAVALFKRRGDKLVWFWALVALLALLLALGSYLPFGIHKLIFHVPVFNLFRVSARNLFIVNLALAVLAGIGVNKLAGLDRSEAMKLWRKGAAVLTLIVVGTLVAYRWFGARLITKTPPPNANWLGNAEVLIPLALFVLALASSWLYARRRTPLAGLLLVCILAIDVASFGHFFEWNVFRVNLAEHLADPPAVKLIKSRESDLNTFRIVTESPWPFGAHYSPLNHPNLSIARGLQSVNGYDMLQLVRLSAVAGEMTPEGWITNVHSFEPPHQGFNLLNVKYALHEVATHPESWYAMQRDGVYFLNALLDTELRRGEQGHVEMWAGARASSLFLMTTMTGSAQIADGEPVARIRLHTADGNIIEREIQAGRDTAEWAYDRADVVKVIKHKRAKVAESWDAETFQSHRYLSRFDFEPAEIERVEFDFARDDQSTIVIARASLFNAETGRSAALDGVRFPPERWRRLGRFDHVEVYENLQAMPRAWFVRRFAVAKAEEVLATIKSGTLPGGGEFNPAETALLEREDFGTRPITLPELGDPSGAQVKITRYEPNHITIETQNPQPGFLVLSEMYYRGWEAWLDGKRVPVEKVNYLLRGVATPAGDHRLEFVFRAHSFRNGAAWSAFGVLVLLVGAVISRRRRKVV